MTAFVIPTQPMPQRFSIALAGVVYNLTVRWNEVRYRGGLATPAWLVDIADAQNARIVSSIPLVTGADLLAQYRHLEIGGSLVVQSDNDPFLVPNFDTLGKTAQLYFVVS